MSTFEIVHTGQSMAQDVLQDASLIPTLTTSYIPAQPTLEIAAKDGLKWGAGDGGGSNGGGNSGRQRNGGRGVIVIPDNTGKGVLIGMLSAFGSAALVGLIIAVVYFFRYTNRGRILLDRFGRPGEFDDEQQFLREGEDAVAEMDESQRAEYLRAKGMYQSAGGAAHCDANESYSFRTSEPTRVTTNRYFSITISCYTRERSFSMGV